MRATHIYGKNMKRLFIDTNILVDVLERREPFFLYSANILNLGATGSVDLYASALSVVNCVYVAKKIIGGQEEMDSALDMHTGDVEDALQYRAALAAQCDALITRNEKHFTFSAIPVYTPEAFLKTTRAQPNDE